MTCTDTEDITATVEQIKRLEKAGCEIVRVAVPTREAASKLTDIRNQINIPLIADIHFHYEFALLSLDQKIDKLRINPGNIGSFDKVETVLLKAKDKGIPVRIGVNSGSVEKDLLDKYGYPSAEAMVESSIRHIEFCEKLGFQDIIVSIKATDVGDFIESNRALARLTDYPMHIGVTEAGMKSYGSIKSAIGIGSLLMEGIGDTIRVSITGDPVDEIPICYDILKATGARVISPEIIACPTCGRIKIDLDKIVQTVENRIKEEKINAPVKISILGCVVNGPGEAREADIGVAGGGGVGIIYRKGEIVRKVKEDEIVDELFKEVVKISKELKNNK
jgi:(E)-4-hydroxy-3-methylbut-2-enyl-diphosphate synthase